MLIKSNFLNRVVLIFAKSRGMTSGFFVTSRMFNILEKPKTLFYISYHIGGPQISNYGNDNNS